MLFTTIAAIMLFYTIFLTKLPHASSSIPKHRWRVKQSPIKAFVGNNSNVWSLSPSSFKSTKPPNHIYFQSNYNGMNFHTTTSRIKLLPIQQHKSKRCISKPSSLSTSFTSSEMTSNERQMNEDALKMINAAIKAVDPNVAVRDRLVVEYNDNNEPKQIVAKADRDGARELVYELSDYDNIRIISFGKASAAMALAAADVLSDSLPQQTSKVPKIDGLVVIKDDHATDEEIKTLNEKHNILVHAASHPVPDARSVTAANEIIELVTSSCSKTLIIACISGGGSALFCSPREGLRLEDLMLTNSRLLESGMPIEKMNVIRKRLENGKGGRLAALAYPSTVLTLVLSDIIGDPLDLIASGPTVPDSSDWDSALRLVEEYDLDSGGAHELPPAVLDLLKMGKTDKLDDTPKSSHPAFSQMNSSSSRKDSKLFSETILVGNNYAAVMAAADEAKILGYNPVILGTRVEGEARHVAGTYVSMAEMLARQRNVSTNNIKYPITALPAALIAGGETIVTLPHKCKGKGGRNQELALTAAIKMQEMGLRDVVLASVGSDGTDGPTDAAGGIVYGGLVNDETYEFAKASLNQHDAYTFLETAKGSLAKTGPTGTNVADICITLIK